MFSGPAGKLRRWTGQKPWSSEQLDCQVPANDATSQVRTGTHLVGKIPKPKPYLWRLREKKRYSNFAYSVFASLRMGMSGSASFQSVRKERFADSNFTTAAAPSAARGRRIVGRSVDHRIWDQSLSW